MRVETPTEQLRAEVTHAGEVYRLVNSSEPASNETSDPFYTGELYNFYKLVYGVNDTSTPSPPPLEEEDEDLLEEEDDDEEEDEEELDEEGRGGRSRGEGGGDKRRGDGKRAC